MARGNATASGVFPSEVGVVSFQFSGSIGVSSGLPVSFWAGGSCTVTGSTVHLTGAGSCSIVASQGGDTNYNLILETTEAWERESMAQGQVGPMVGAVDETFLERMMLVCMDLVSG